MFAPGPWAPVVKKSGLSWNLVECCWFMVRFQSTSRWLEQRSLLTLKVLALNATASLQWLQLRRHPSAYSIFTELNFMAVWYLSNGWLTSVEPSNLSRFVSAIKYKVLSNVRELMFWCLKFHAMKDNNSNRSCIELWFSLLTLSSWRYIWQICFEAEILTLHCHRVKGRNLFCLPFSVNCLLSDSWKFL